MKKLLPFAASLLGMLCVWLPVHAQDVKWNTAPLKGLVYEISNREAQKLLTGQSYKSIGKTLLHTRIDTFDVRRGWLNRPSKGHFILANVVGNTLHCEYACVFPYQVFLLREYNAMSLQVVDPEGNVRTDARVKAGFRRVAVDPDSKTYRIDNNNFPGLDPVITVELFGFRSMYSMHKHEVPTTYNWDDDDPGPAFYSYLITDKNKYKPGEKVRFKTYALSHLKSPLRRELEIWLNGYPKRVKLGTVNPYRPGGYSGEFLLHDSLKLELDKNYQLDLREKGGRQVATCSFRFEDYELTGNKLKLDIEKVRQYAPEQNHLTITATDANGLILRDARATVLIRANTILCTFQPLTVLQDTLLFTHLVLDPAKPTVFEIPWEIFKKTNASYDIVVTVLNSQNQRMEGMRTATFYYFDYELKPRLSHDSICFILLKNNVPLTGVATEIKTDLDLEVRSVTLPYCEKLNPAIHSYHFKNQLIVRDVSLSSLAPVVKLNGGIQKDSFKISLVNPQKLDVSWYIYQGSRLLTKGSGTELEYASSIEDRTETYYAELLFSFGGQDQAVRRQFEFKEEYLNVSLDIPDRIYPGQKVDATITVIDQLGKPVRNVDITAMAATSKLDYVIADLPYFGNSSTPRSKGATYSKEDLNRYVANLPLDYRKLAPDLRLDTMQYFQFLFPSSEGFIRTVPCHDSTQFTVYVLKDGLAREIHVIELDRKPVYYSWTNQPKGYSFYVVPKVQHQLTLRLSDRLLILDSLTFKRGTKTIISLDADHLPHGTKVIEMENKFTPTEINRHRAYVAAFQATKSLYAYLQSPGEFVPIYSRYNFFKNSPVVGTIIAGPIVPEKKTYVEIETLKTAYRHTGGFRYVFEDNIVYKSDASDLLPKLLTDATYNPAQTIGDGVINWKIFLAAQNQSPRSDVKWIANTFDLSDPAMRMRIFLPQNDGMNGIAALLFEDPVTKKIVPPSFNKYYHNLNGSFRLPRGFSSLIVLYENGTYIRVDSILFRVNTLVAADLSHTAIHPPDEVSFVWLRENMSRPDNYSETNYAPSWQKREIHYHQHNAGNIHGTVYDENNEPLPGVVILIQGTENGTITDLEGNFSLQIDTDVATLVISSIGYTQQELQVTWGSVVTVNMEPAVLALSEVVVVGYGTQHRQSLTGSVAGISIVDTDMLPAEMVEEAEQIEEAQLKKQADEQLYQELRNLQTIRSNFSDVGFWEPRLVTDSRGKSGFSVTFPDDVTRWNAVVYAMNRYLQTGTGRKSIQSYKPILAELAVPQFLTRGDSSFFLGKVTNYTADSTIQGTVNWKGPASQPEKEILFTTIHTDMVPVVANDTDSITARFTFTRNDGYVDGEERTVAVTEQGIERAEGEWAILSNGKSKHVTAKAGEHVMVKILDNQTDLYAGEIDYLLHYRYDCNEQLASKLIGLINMKKLMQYQGKRFAFDRDVNTIIRRLLKNQNDDFLWSWWDVSGHSSYWMSAHVLRALKCAIDEGYKVALDIENVIRKAQYKFDILKEFSVSDVELLDALALWGADLNYSRYVPVLDSTVKAQEHADLLTARRLFHEKAIAYSYLKEKMLLQEVRQLKGIGYQRDSLVKYQREGMLGDVFFSDKKPGRHWYDDNLAANTIAYRIVERDSVLKNMIPGLQLYFLHSRTGNSWNTYQSSEILLSVLSTLVKTGSEAEHIAEVTLTGSENKTIHEFPYMVVLHPGSELEVRKNTGIPLYFVHYVTERVTSEKTGRPGLTVKTSFSSPGMLLEAGKPVDLIAEVTVQKDSPAEHVMLEVPIPGGCSYADKRQGENPVETHREYFKEKTVIFCESMAPGTYVFHIRLLPRFTGTYFLNPAQVSLMYIPVVNANTDMKKVRVE